MILLALALAASGPVASTDDGPVRGEALGKRGGVFRGIRFARPPTGALRWKPPERPDRWTGPVDAIARHAACPQPIYGDWNRAASKAAAEDCLFLDVRSPRLSAKARLPVMVWIHGGGNRAGSGGGTVESRITDRGIVLVSIQYRLGALGFLSHPALSAEQGGTSGNYGIQDQQLALRWVKRNIAAFGGDPPRVTIAGESAGAQDVGLHLLVPGSRGLFVRAIEESGTAGFGSPSRSLAKNERLGVMIAAKAGLRMATPAQLRALPVDRIIAAQEVVDVPDLDDDSFIWLQAVVDGRVLADTPAHLLASGRINPAALIIGNNAKELTLYGGRAAAEGTVRREFGPAADRALALYGLGANRIPVTDPRLGDVTLQLADDLTFRCPSIAVAKALAARGHAVWHYQFDYTPADGTAVTHAGEVRYVFDSAIAGAPPLQSYWVNFVKTGDPNGAGLPRWPAYDVQTRPFVSFTDRGTTPGRNLRGAICDLRGTP